MLKRMFMLMRMSQFSGLGRIHGDCLGESNEDRLVRVGVDDQKKNSSSAHVERL